MKRLIDPTTIQEVIPNPSGEATETLSKLGVNGKVYGVGGGGGSDTKMYLHKITVQSNAEYLLRIALYSSSLTPFTSFADIVANLDKIYLTPAFLLHIAGGLGECTGLIVALSDIGLSEDGALYRVVVKGGVTRLSIDCSINNSVEDIVIEL